MFEIEKKTLTNNTGEQSLRYRISGTIDIESIAELKRQILEGFNASEHLVLDWDAVEDIDFTALQLMCAANLYAYEHDKTFELKNNLSSSVAATVKNLGFIRETGCSRENKARCLWVNREASGE